MFQSFTRACLITTEYILSRPSSGVTYKGVDSQWKRDLQVFASLITTINYNKSATVITA
jgi:hypothetical protein